MVYVIGFLEYMMIMICTVIGTTFTGHRILICVRPGAKCYKTCPVIKSRTLVLRRILSFKKERIQVDACEARYAETGEQNCQCLKLWKPQYKDCMNEPHLIVDRPAAGDSLHRHCVPGRSGTSSYQTWKRKDAEQTKDGRR